MHALLESLVEDHRHMLRLINCLNFQGYLLAEQDCDDYFILMEILDYLPMYLDQYHHPVEDRYLCPCVNEQGNCTNCVRVGACGASAMLETCRECKGTGDTRKGQAK